MRYYIQIWREKEESFGTNDNLKGKPVYLGQVIDGPDIERNLPDKKKSELVEGMMENTRMKLTEKDIEINEEEKVFVMPNPLIAEEQRRLQKSVYKGKVEIPERIRKSIQMNKK